MKEAVFLPFPSRSTGGSQVTAKNSNDRMSVAQKEWPVRGRILMARMSKTNEGALEKKTLAGGVALITGGGPRICRAPAPQLALFGASPSLFGPGFPPPQDFPPDTPRTAVPFPTPN